MADVEVLVYGAVFLVFGVPMALWPETISRWNEILDAIGRKPAGPVEPAEWQVTLTWIAGIALSLVGGLFLVLALV